MKISIAVCSLTLGLIAMPGAFAAAPVSFSAPTENAKVFYATETLHKGDVLQVRAPHLLADETLILGRCSDADACKSAQIVSVWKHGFHSGTGINNRVIRSNINLQQDGRYFFWLVKNSDCYVDGWGCRNSAWPSVLTYGNPQALPITRTTNDGAYFKVKYDSGSLIYVRRLDPNGARG